MATTRRRAELLLILIVFFGVLSLGGLLAMSRSLADTRHAVRNTEAIAGILQYGARRGDCVRDVQATYEQQFIRDITDLLTAGRSNPAQSRAVVARMQAEAKKNYADQVTRQCPPAVKP